MNAPSARASAGGVFFAWTGVDMVCVSVLFALVLIFQRALLDPAQVYSSYDFARDIYPSFHWLHARFASGRGVFWDQSSGLGDPVFDRGGSAYLYAPMRFAVTWMDAVPAVAACMVFHYYIAALGAYGLARSRRASAVASLVAAVAVAFSGGMAVASSSFGLLIPLAWFPWMILGLKLVHDGDGSLGRRPLVGASILGLSTGMSLLGGHIGMGVCEVYALAALHLAHCATQRNGLRRLFRSLPLIVTAGLIAALLFAGQALGIARLASQAGRGVVYSVAQASEGAMNPVTLAQVVLPDLLGRLKDATFLGQSWRFGTNDPQGAALYLGVPAFVLGIFFLASFPWRLIFPWATAWLFLVLYSLGAWTPLFGHFYYHLPFLGHLHWNVRAAFLCAPLLCVPLALALDRLQARTVAWPAYFSLGLGLALVLAGLGLWAADGRLEHLGRRFVLARIVGTGMHPYSATFYLDKLARWLKVARLHLVGQGLWSMASGLVLAALVALPSATGRSRAVLVLGLLLFLELNANLSGYNPVLPRALLFSKPLSAEKILSLEGPGAPPFRTLSWGFGYQLRRSFPKGHFFGDLRGELLNNELLPPALNKIYGLDLCTAYPSPDLLRLRPFTGWFRDLDMQPPQAAEDLWGRRRLFDLCGAKYFVLGAPLSAWRLIPLLSDPVYLYRNEGALPLAFVADHYSGGWTPASAVAALTSTASVQARWERPALIEGPGIGSGDSGGGQVRWLKYDDLEWRLDVDSAAPGFVVLSRLYYPGPWKASVNGRPAPILAADGALCAVPLGGGPEVIRVYYDDTLPRLGLALQVLGWALAFFGLLLALRLGGAYHLGPKAP